jgi:DNA-binding MarR family transcriptional regulator
VSRTTTVDRTEVAAALRIALGRLVRRLRQGDTPDLTPGKLLTLVTVEQHGPIRVGDLAARERVAAPTMTRIVQALEASGYVQRLSDPDDGRSARIAVTARGRGQLEGMRRARTAYLAERLARLDAADMARLLAALPVLEALSAEEIAAPLP